MKVTKRRLLDLLAPVFAVVLALGTHHFGAKILAPRPTKQQESGIAAAVTIGTQLDLQGVRLSDNVLTILLVVSPTCKYCLQNSSFHKALLDTAINKRLPLYVAVPKPSVPTTDSYLKKTKLINGRVIDWTAVNIDIRATPTLIIADATGIIRRAWVGAIEEDKQETVLQILADPSILTDVSSKLQNGIQNISTSELEMLHSKDGRQVVDVRERNLFAQFHRANALNIPASELSVRAPVELSTSYLQVVDCSHIRRKNCESSVSVLSRLNYRVVALNSGAVFENFCLRTSTGK